MSKSSVKKSCASSCCSSL